MAVPVRTDLLAGLSELDLRAARAVNRSQSLARERLEARAQRLPRLADLLSPQQQRADDLGERLRAGLGLRLAHARGTLAQVSGALRPAVLETRAALASERLNRLAGDPAVLDRIAARAAERLAGLERVLTQLDPDAPLQRGYARVTADDGRTLVDRVAAKGEPRLTLHFRDGTLDVSPVEGAPSPPGPARARPKPAEPRQPSFL
jgi:exodeoxyribonuclease VII large subunit